MRYFILSFIALISMTLIVSCSKDPIPINVVTTVVEYAIDSTKNNKRLANVLVEILGCTQGAYS